MNADILRRQEEEVKENELWFTDVKKQEDKLRKDGAANSMSPHAPDCNCGEES